MVREMAQEAQWRGFQTARQREGPERGPPRFVQILERSETLEQGEVRTESFPNRDLSCGSFLGGEERRPRTWGAPGEGGTLGWIGWPERNQGASGGPPSLLLTCRCSRSSSSFTFSTWAASAVESRSTWCLGRAGGKMKGLSHWDWPFTLPRWEAGGMEQPGIPGLGPDPLAEQEKA